MDDTGNFFWQEVRGRYSQQQLDDAITTAGREFGYEVELSTEDSERCIVLEEAKAVSKKRMRINYDTRQPNPDQFEVFFDGPGMHSGSEDGPVNEYMARVYKLLENPQVTEPPKLERFYRCLFKIHFHNKIWLKKMRAIQKNSQLTILYRRWM